MSVRDLAKATGISMGSIYYCINRKEDLAIIVLDSVELVAQHVMSVGQNQSDDLQRLLVTVQHHLYASHILQPWFFFLFFEKAHFSPL